MPTSTGSSPLQPRHTITEPEHAARGSDDESVIDADLAVHGPTGLNVVDASVFPTLTSDPNHAAILAVAET